MFFSAVINPWLEPLFLIKGDNSVYFGSNEAMFNIKLQVSIVAHVLCFILEVGYEFLGGFPTGDFNVTVLL